MQRFSADSDERISVNFHCNDEAVVPKFAVQSETKGFFTGFRNPAILVTFSVFWLALFHLLSRLTRPVPEALEALDGKEVVAN